MDVLTEFFSSVNELYTKKRELAAIWLTKPLQTSTERTVRLAPDHLIRIEGNELVDVIEGKEATHKVVCCMGTAVNQFEIEVIGILNNETLKIEL